MIAPVDVTNIRIETERLILRPWQESDLADFYEYASVDGVGQMAGWMPHKNMEESKIILGFFIGGKNTLALEMKNSGKVIGSIGIEEPDFDPVEGEKYGRELGFVLSKDYWGRGLMPEAVKAVIDYCFTELGFDWLTCGHFVWNDQSRRVVEKCGFRYVQDVIHHTRFGTEEPTKLYVLYNPQKMTAPMDVTDVRLETQRLVLRPWLETDMQAFHEYVSDEAVAPGMGWICSASPEESRKQLENYIQSKEHLAIVRKDTGKPIGDICMQVRYWVIYPIDRTLRGRELGFGIASAHWGQGLMPEAVKAVVSYCFDVLNYGFITAGHFRENSQSRRVIEKSGFSLLFEDDRKMPNGRDVHLCTYIQYNPNK